ncbi:GNAT family N-acetyltransferase [Paenibacillus sp. RC84]|uniref:GNAT family N-acetyltransferase n=1 Tax=Paenibacillus sp. RC84 TaxID=3156252 RepID=UPI003514000B
MDRGRPGTYGGLPLSAVKRSAAAGSKGEVTKMGDIFRLAEESDTGQLLTLIEGAYRAIRDLNIDFRATRADYEFVRTNMEENACYVLERDGRISATLSLKYMEEVSVYPFLFMFAVHPAEQSQGVGSRLLRYVEEEIVRDTLLSPASTLATSRKHPWLLPFYERKGYQPFYERDLGTDDRLVFMIKNLRSGSGTDREDPVHSSGETGAERYSFPGDLKKI